MANPCQALLVTGHQSICFVSCAVQTIFKLYIRTTEPVFRLCRRLVCLSRLLWFRQLTNLTAPPLFTGIYNALLADKLGPFKCVAFVLASALAVLGLVAASLTPFETGSVQPDKEDLKAPLLGPVDPVDCPA